MGHAVTEIGSVTTSHGVTLGCGRSRRLGRLAPEPFARLIPADNGASVTRIDRVPNATSNDVLCHKKLSIAFLLKKASQPQVPAPNEPWKSQEDEPKLPGRSSSGRIPAKWRNPRTTAISNFSKIPYTKKGEVTVVNLNHFEPNDLALFQRKDIN